jgi:hypothetical protein
VLGHAALSPFLVSNSPRQAPLIYSRAWADGIFSRHIVVHSGGMAGLFLPGTIYRRAFDPFDLRFISSATGFC